MPRKAESNRAIKLDVLYVYSYYTPVKASVVDLRYNMREVLAAIKRREVVNVEYRNKRIAKIIPDGPGSETDLMNHEFFGSARDTRSSVYDVVRAMRKRRYLDL